MDRVVPCALERRLHEGVSLAFRRGAGGWCCVARSLGAFYNYERDRKLLEGLQVYL